MWCKKHPFGGWHPQNFLSRPSRAGLWCGGGAPKCNPPAGGLGLLGTKVPGGGVSPGKLDMLSPASRWPCEAQLVFGDPIFPRHPPKGSPNTTEKSAVKVIETGSGGRVGEGVRVTSQAHE